MRRLAVIGGGFMGEAIFSRAIRAGVVEAGNVIVGEPLADRRGVLEQQYQVQTTADNAAAAEAAALLLLATKPQQNAAVFASLRGHLDPTTVVLSIIAGTPLSTLTTDLEHQVAVRVMPNTPAAVGEGMTVWAATSAVSSQQCASVRSLLRSIGREIQVETDRSVDMATAINGSGPGYVFLIMEALIDAGVQIGLSRPQAHDLVVQTMLGAAALARDTGKHPAELRNMVTTPGGTTAAGLLALEEHGLRAALARGVLAAYERSVALGAAQAQSQENPADPVR